MSFPTVFVFEAGDKRSTDGSVQAPFVTGLGRDICLSARKFGAWASSQANQIMRMCQCSASAGTSGMPYSRTRSSQRRLLSLAEAGGAGRVGVGGHELRRHGFAVVLVRHHHRLLLQVERHIVVGRQRQAWAMTLSRVSPTPVWLRANCAIDSSTPSSSRYS